MHTSNRTYFESVRYIKSKETESNLEVEIAQKLVVKPDYVPYDQLQIKRLNQQALESLRAMRYFNRRLITEEEYNRRIEELNDQREQKERAIKKKQFNQDKAIRISNAVMLPFPP